MNAPTVFTVNEYGDNVGPMGYAAKDERQVQRDGDMLKAMQDLHPERFGSSKPRILDSKFIEKVKEAQAKDGLTNGISLRYMSVPLFNSILMFLAQIIGSCVASGAFRLVVFRSLVDVLAVGEPEKLMGMALRGLGSIAPFAPYIYGCGRRRGGMRGGDGSYCSVQIEALQKDGILQCDAPGLSDIVGNREIDYPEPQGREGARLYRQFGDWKYLDQFKQEAQKIKLNKTEIIQDAQSMQRALEEDLAGAMICSGWAFKPDYKHKDGVWIYTRDRSNSWSHNMSITGIFILSDGLIVIEVLNSWGPDAHKDGEVFYIRLEEFHEWVTRGRANCATIGDLDLEDDVQAPVPVFGASQ